MAGVTLETRFLIGQMLSSESQAIELRLLVEKTRPIRSLVPLAQRFSAAIRLISAGFGRVATPSLFTASRCAKLAYYFGHVLADVVV